VTILKAAVLFSGGKDSTMAIFEAIAEGWDVEYLVSMHSQNKHSYMFHVPNISLTQQLAEAMEIELISAKTLGEKEEELKDLRKVLKFLKNRGLEGVFSGALASSYQKTRIDHLCDELGLISVAPLWQRDPLEYMNQIIQLGFEVIITSVAAEGLDESYLGCKIDHELLDKLLNVHEKTGIHIAFEGGEAETLVLNGPLFKKKLEIIESVTIWEGDCGYLLVKDAILKDKH
jgi:ABC transporter with metal-binding/Fe-S-binding domain ATP-binding protein